MIDEEHRCRRLDTSRTQLTDLLNGQRPRAVLGDRHIDIGDDDLPGYDTIDAGVGGNDLLGKCERHM